MHKSKIKKTLMLFYVGLVAFFALYNKAFAEEVINCEGETIEFIRNIFNIVKIAIPVLLIVLGLMDFVKAIIASDDQKMKKAQKDFITRLIIGAVIFFIPSVLEFLLSLIGIESCNI